VLQKYLKYGENCLLKTVPALDSLSFLAASLSSLRNWLNALPGIKTPATKTRVYTLGIDFV